MSQVTVTKREFLAWILGLFLFAVPQSAKADFIGNYPLSDWSLFNVDVGGPTGNGCFVDPNGPLASANVGVPGCWITPDDGASIVLTGPNDGSGLPGTTEFLIGAGTEGTVQFNWSYSSQDSAGFDNAGFLADGVFTQLANSDGQSGTASFTVTAGESFGFCMGSVDNQGEPGILTIFGFSAPGHGSAVTQSTPCGANIVSSAPEPTLTAFLFLIFVTIAAQQQVSRAKVSKGAK